MRILAVIASLLVLCSCSAEPERACTLIGTRVGIGLDVDLPGVRTAALEVCWDGTCVNPAVVLSPATSNGQETCTGTRPDDSCGVSVVPTNGMTGFAEVTNLPAKLVTAKVTLADATGAVLLDEDLTLTPKSVYPNGPDCGGGGPQASLDVSAAGVVTEHS